MELADKIIDVLEKGSSNANYILSCGMDSFLKSLSVKDCLRVGEAIKVHEARVREGKI